MTFSSKFVSLCKEKSSNFSTTMSWSEHLQCKTLQQKQYTVILLFTFDVCYQPSICFLIIRCGWHFNKLHAIMTGLAAIHMRQDRSRGVTVAAKLDCRPWTANGCCLLLACPSGAGGGITLWSYGRPTAIMHISMLDHWKRCYRKPLPVYKPLRK